MATIDDGTTCYVTVSPKDKSNAAAAPIAGTYRVVDVDSGVDVLAEESITANTPLSSAMELTLLGSTVNVFVDPTRKTERRKVTVKLEYSSDDTLNSEYEIHAQEPIRRMSDGGKL